MPTALVAPQQHELVAAEDVGKLARMHPRGLQLVYLHLDVGQDGMAQLIDQTRHLGLDILVGQHVLRQAAVLAGQLVEQVRIDLLAHAKHE